jgi:hypothetical protein
MRRFASTMSYYERAIDLDPSFALASKEIVIQGLK